MFRSILSWNCILSTSWTYKGLIMECFPFIDVLFHNRSSNIPLSCFCSLPLHYSKSHFDFVVTIYTPSAACALFFKKSPTLLCIYTHYYICLPYDLVFTVYRFKVGFVNGNTSSQSSLEVIYKFMHYLHLWPTIAFPCSCKQIYKYVVYNSF